MSGDGKVVDLGIRRAQQRRASGEVTQDPVIRASERLTTLYGELAMEVDVVVLLASIALAERALMVMLIHSVGEGAAKAMAEEGMERAESYSMAAPTHYRGPTVFDRDEDDPDKG